MAEKVPGKLLAKGGIRKVDKHVSKPILHQFCGSYNSGKATLAMRLSQKAADCDIRYVIHMRDNYTLEYARLNPDTMAVPTMEIDDVVCTDSMDLCKYLMEHYPGPGDQEVVAAGKKEEMMAWVDFAASWDEYMFTYGNMSENQATMPNEIRLINLRSYLNQCLTEQPSDMDFLVNAYVNKIAGINNMMRAQVTGTQKENDLKENRVLLDRVLARANELAGQHSSGFLFGEKLTTGDVFFLPILRIFFMVKPEMFDEVFQTCPNLKGYWERAQAHPDVEAGLMTYVRKTHMAWAMLKCNVPGIILGYKLGLSKAPKLPDDIEKRITDATEMKWQQLRG